MKKVEGPVGQTAGYDPPPQEPQLVAEQDEQLLAPAV